MASFKKGQSYKGQRVHVSGAFPQKGNGMTGMNVSFSISNDTREPDDVMTNPMLVYDTYEDANGKQKDSFTASYSAKQWEAIEAAGNKDGDALVLEADLFPPTKGKGLRVNTNSLKTPETPFNKEAHTEKTLAAREAKKAAKANKENEQGKEQEKEVELEA